MDDILEHVQKAKEGDRDSFGEIYNQYYKQLYRYCQFNLRDTVLAQDVVQETFLRAWKGIGKFSFADGGTMQAFLYRIARNLIIDHSRRKKSSRLVEHENLEAESEFEESVDRDAEKEKLKKALDELNEKDRQIVILRYLEEMSFAEVSKVVKIREGALRVRVHRILDKLKKIIENDRG